MTWAPLLPALLSPALSLAQPPGAMPRPVNDNVFRAQSWCRQLFSVSPTTVQVDLHTVSVRRTFETENRADSPFAAWPRFVMNAHGVIARANRVSRGAFEVAVIAPGEAVERHAWPAASWLGRFAALSGDHEFAIVTDRRSKTFRLVRVKTGEVIEERVGSPSADASMQFTGDGRYVTLRLGSVVQIFDPHSRTMLSTYDVARAFGQETVVRATKRGRGGEVYFVARTHGLLTLDPTASPTLLGLRPNGIFRRESFPPVPGAEESKRKGDFGRDAIVSPSERWLFATRHLRPEGQLSTVIDVFDLVDRKYVRSFAVPGEVKAMALSRDERQLAVAVPKLGEIQVWDLWRSGRSAAVLAQLEPRAISAALAFTDAGHLLYASDLSDQVREFRLPIPDMKHPDVPDVFIQLDP